MTDTIYVDRSRIEAAGVCMRRRFWGWEWMSRGLDTPGLALALSTGTAVHNGIEYVLCDHGLEAAVALALQGYQAEVEDAGFTVPPETPRLLTEELEIAEALIRAFALATWPTMRDDYETLGVEREETARFDVDGREVILMARPDWTVRRRADGSVFVINFKTVSRADKLWREQWRYDMQTLSEALCVEERLGEPVAGTMILGLLKGSKPWTADDKAENPDPSRLRVNHNSPLIYCWHRPGEPPMTEAEYVPLNKYEWSCTEPHDHGVLRKCKGNVNHRLGKGYYKAPVSTVYPGGVKGWLTHLMATDPALVRAQIIDLPPILRSPYEIERWKRQTLDREVHIARESESIHAAMQVGIELNEAVLDRVFPMSTQHGNCIRPGQCSFVSICWGIHGQDPLGSGYVMRTANHDTEVLVDTTVKEPANL